MRSCYILLTWLTLHIFVNLSHSPLVVNMLIKLTNDPHKIPKYIMLNRCCLPTVITTASLSFIEIL